MSIFQKESEPQPYTVKDKQLVCSHCGNDTFSVDDMMVHHRGSLSNDFVTVFTCANCTQMIWFRGE